jgi:hypothetical protein
MLSRLQITVVLAITAACWWVALLVQGTQVTGQYLRPFSAVVVVLVILGLVIEYWAWRVHLFQPWLFSRPDLRGTWKVTIESEWVDNTGQKIAPIRAYVGVTQTNSKLQFHLMTPESESCLLASSIAPTVCGERFEVAAVYANTPNVSLRGVRSERHVGAFILGTHGAKKFKPDAMTAEYWTDRKSVGRMTFEGRVDALYSRFEEARSKMP